MRLLVRRHGSGRSCFSLSKLLKFSQNVVVMLREVANDPRIGEQLTKIAIGEHKIEMIGALGLLGDSELPLEVD
jgi:hypothetical protein